jgi:hypothetical protein
MDRAPAPARDLDIFAPLRNQWLRWRHGSVAEREDMVRLAKKFPEILQGQRLRDLWLGFNTD